LSVISPFVERSAVALFLRRAKSCGSFSHATIRIRRVKVHEKKPGHRPLSNEGGGKMLRTTIAGITILLLLPAVSLALPRIVLYSDDPHCDPLFVPQNVHELGIAPAFAALPLELITSSAIATEVAACPADDPLIANVRVSITNTTGIAWADLWYVADPFVDGVGTFISNYDGFVDDAAGAGIPSRAFKIDTVGVNVPLVSESIAADGIFSPGETWAFIIDDYSNSFGLSAAAFDSMGVASASPGGPPSSGSIIAVPVPEPGTFALLAIGSIGIAMCVGVTKRNR
jgi:PEP-CTERM motif